MSKAMRLKPKFDIWTDGSYQPTRDRGGIGAVVDYQDQRKTFSNRLPSLDTNQMRHGSDFAELYAFASALDLLPSRAVIDLRMDCQNVIDWLNKKELACKQATTREALQGVFAYAMRGIQRMETVTLIKSSDRDDQNMALADSLSREGAALSPSRR